MYEVIGAMIESAEDAAGFQRLHTEEFRPAPI
jgi:hypothetical protein